MDKETRRIFRNNIIKFLIGVFLLIISYIYIQGHPAEKSSIFSGFEIIWQKIEIVFHKLTNQNYEALKKKYSFEQIYQELIQMAENSTCKNATILTDINETLIEMKKENLTDLVAKFSFYSNKAGEYKSRIEKCKK
ncbi:MAG: hypothetical protein WC872_01320 [Candidatus Absconditabacterales bacterium]